MCVIVKHSTGALKGFPSLKSLIILKGTGGPKGRMEVDGCQVGDRDKGGETKMGNVDVQCYADSDGDESHGHVP